MTGLDEPWASVGHPTVGYPSVELIQLSPAAIDALAANDLAAANACAPVELTAYFVAPASARTWRYRSVQLMGSPTDASWVTRVIYDPERQIAVGQSGFHGPPDPVGMVEIGFAVDSNYRRQGYARAALLALLERARVEPAVQIVRATIQPTNVASRGLIAQFGFVEVGEQWDDEDGLETIFERNV